MSAGGVDGVWARVEDRERASVLWLGGTNRRMVTGLAQTVERLGVVGALVGQTERRETGGGEGVVITWCWEISDRRGVGEVLVEMGLGNYN